MNWNSPYRSRRERLQPVAAVVKKAGGHNGFQVLNWCADFPMVLPFTCALIRFAEAKETSGKLSEKNMNPRLSSALALVSVCLLSFGCASNKLTQLENLSSNEAVAIARFHILHNGKD